MKFETTTNLQYFSTNPASNRAEKCFTSVIERVFTCTDAQDKPFITTVFFFVVALHSGRRSYLPLGLPCTWEGNSSAEQGGGRR